MHRLRICPLIALAVLVVSSHLRAADDVKPAIAAKIGRDDSFRPMDVFHLEYASDPQISPDGKRVVYVRHFMDVMKDRRRSNLWIINVDGNEHRPMTTGTHNDGSPRWSPDGKRLLYVSSVDGS